MRVALTSMLYSALILSSPALAETAQSEWKEGKFRELNDWIYYGAGIRFSNCHLVRIDMGALQAVPKCYVFNRGDKAARVKVRFVALDGEGSPVIDTTIVGLIDIQPATGTELSQYLPITADEWGRIETGRLQAWAATK